VTAPVRIITVSPDELRAIVRDAVREELASKPAGLALLKPEDVAKMLDVTRETVLEMARRGEIPHKRCGRYYRFAEAELQQWAARRAG